MWLKCYFIFIYMAGFLKLCYCQRRNYPEGERIKKYVVYFVQSPHTKMDVNAWRCGGALVSPTQILTAAACLVEVENIYAIAGYNKYVDAKDIENDECTKARKQRVVKILVPTEYKLAYENPAQWINVDVGVAIVEKPYNFSDLTYRTHCSYEPQPIFVNFENKYELESTHAVALGWGSMEPENQETAQLLQESPTVIVEKTVCANTVKTQEIIYIIENYLLCTSNNMDDTKEIKAENEPSQNCTIRRYDLTKATDNNGCFEDDFGFRRNDEKRKNNTNKDEDNIMNSKINRTHPIADTDENYLYTSLNGRKSSSSSRNQGKCQNSHGCPLIRWVGEKEVVIGVASNVNKNNQCKGPFLYVSTAATSKIIKCLLETNSMTRKFCNQEISDKRYEVQEIDVPWPDYTEKTPVPLAIPIIKRSIPDDRPLIHRPTKDIVKDQLTQPGHSLEQPAQSQAHVYDQPPEQFYNRGQSYSQPRTQMDEQPLGNKLMPRNSQANEQPPNTFGAPLAGSLPGQQYDAPSDLQYKPPFEQQYGAPSRQQYEQPPAPQYEPPMSQQNESPPGQFELPQYEPSPGHQYEPPPGQQYAPPPGQQYEPQADQVYETPGQQYEILHDQQLGPKAGPQYGPTLGEHYESQPGSQYNQPSDQQYESQLQHGQQNESPPGRQYEPLMGQQYELPQGKLYDSPLGKQYDSLPGKQYDSQPEKGFESPLGEQYVPLPKHQNAPSPPRQYEPQLGDHYDPLSGHSGSMDQQYEPASLRQEESLAKQPYPPSLEQAFKSPLIRSSEPPLSRQNEQVMDLQYESEQSYKNINSQPQGQLRQLRDQPSKQQKRQEQSYLQEFENLYRQQNQKPNNQKHDEFIQSQNQHPNIQTSDQKPFKPYQLPMDKFDSTYQKPIDQMFSQLRGSQMGSQVHEETFDQMYSHLHEPSFDLPHELNVPQYNGPPDDGFEEGQSSSNNQPSGLHAATTEQTNIARIDDVRVRPQMPVDYQNDYFFYSYRRNGSNL